MTPIPTISSSSCSQPQKEDTQELSPRCSSDNLSVSSVTRKISAILNGELGSSGGTEPSESTETNFLPSDTLLAVNISEAISKGDLDSLTQILNDLNTTAKDFNSPYGNLLHIAVTLAKFDDFKKILIKFDLDPNSQCSQDNSTPLHLATKLNRNDIVEYLLSLKEINDTLKDKDGLTPIDYCTKNPSLLTIFEQSRMIFREKTMKTLFKATYKQKLKETQEILLNPRARSLIDFNCPNTNGDTILHMAAKGENAEIVKICLKVGVDPFMKNRRGKIAIELTKNPVIKELLKQAPMIRSKEIPMPSFGNSGFKVEGYLLKYTNFAGGYRKRWFVLENSLLSYYNSPSEYPVSCRGSINLEYVQIVLNPNNPCKFDLVGGMRTEVKIHLKAEAQDEAKRWIIALKQAKSSMNASNEKVECLSPLNVLNVISPSHSTSTMASAPTSPIFSNEVELGIMALLRQETKITELLSQIEGSSELDRFFNDNISNLKDIFMRLEQLLSQKNRRLEAQRKEKDLLEDAVRSLANENNKWQTWARSQLSRLDSPTSRNTSSPVDVNVNSDVLQSLEDQLESTLEVKGSDEDSDEFYDIYESENELSDIDELSELSEIGDIDNGKKQTKDEDKDKGYSDPSEPTIVTVTSNLIPTDTDNYGYPLRARKRIPVDSSKMPAISLWNILKNAIRQQDLTRMPIPINFSEPLSMLQRMCEDLEYFELLEEAKSYSNDPARRLLYIAAYAITSYSSTDKRTSKPFNPLLGETFELVTLKFRYLSEQVSHHPPIGASHCTAKGYTYWNEVHVTSRFRGKYLELRPEGLSHLLFDDSDPENQNGKTHYSWNRVNTAVNNIIVGKIYLEHYGKMRIQSHGSDGLVAEIDFLPSGWRRGTSNRIEGKIFNSKTDKLHYTISGTWNQSLMVENVDTSETFQIWKRNQSPPDSESMYNFSYFSMGLNELTAELSSSICPTDSRLRPDQRAMEEGEFDSAAKLKVKLEEKQRKARKQNENDPNFVYKPRWFKRSIERDTGEEHWEYNGGYWECRSVKQWTDIPEIYL